MLAFQLINQDIGFISIQQTATEILNIMNLHKVEHLPIFNNNNLLGIVSEKDILNLKNLNISISNYNINFLQVTINPEEHIYNIFKILLDNNLTLLPVMNAESQYLGCITLKNLSSKFANISNINKPGSIIILELNYNDYLLSQIAQIVEYNDAKIINSTIINKENSTQIEVVLKINKIDISGIVQTFNRYDYKVKYIYSDSIHNESIKEKYDEFINWLNV